MDLLFLNINRHMDHMLPKVFSALTVYKFCVFKYIGSTLCVKLCFDIFSYLILTTTLSEIVLIPIGNRVSESDLKPSLQQPPHPQLWFWKVSIFHFGFLTKTFLTCSVSELLICLIRVTFCPAARLLPTFLFYVFSKGEEKYLRIHIDCLPSKENFCQR